jgi:hypothetical protein
MAARLQSSEQLLRRELQQYSKDPSAGAAQGLNSIKVSLTAPGILCLVHSEVMSWLCMMALSRQHLLLL